MLQLATARPTKINLNFGILQFNLKVGLLAPSP
jgi:hypothetical protein